MKNFLRVISFFMIFSLISCNNSKAQEVKNIKLQVYNYKVIAQFSDIKENSVSEENLWLVSGSAVIPEIIVNNNIKELRDSLIKLSGIIIVNDHIAQPDLDKEMELTDLKPDQTEAGNEMSNELSIDLLTPDFIVWKDFSHIYYYMAAHGFYATSYLNYSIRTGEILSPKDLFIAGYEPTLIKMINDKIKEENVDTFANAQIEISENFRITSDAIEFIYGLYEIAPYSSGEVVVSLPLWKISELLQPRWKEIL